MKLLRPNTQKSAVLLDFCPAARKVPKVKIGVRVTFTLASE
jgi:hypothetical protein